MKKITSIIVFNILFCSSINTQWIQLTSPSPNSLNSVYFLNVNTGFICGSLNGNVIKTTDGGSSWIFTVTGSTNIFYDLYFESTQTGYVAGASKQIVKTTNSGLNWDIKTSGSGTLYSMSFPTTLTGYAVGGLPTVLNKSTDGGNNWSTLTPPSGNVLKGVFFIDNLLGWVCGASGTIWKTTDGCTSWTPQTQSSTFNLEKVIFINSTTGFTVGGNGVILKTTNAGTNWAQLSTGINANLFDIAYIGPNTFWAVGAGRIIKSTDLGNTWGMQNNPSPTSTYNSIHMIDANTGYIVGNGVLLKTTNGGGSIVIPCFTRITNGDLVNDNAYGEGTAWGDYDGDGDQDVVVTNYNDACQSCTHPILLYRNDGGTFTKITTGPIASEVTRGFGCSWGDYDNDGRLDLFISTGQQIALTNLLFHNEGNGNFTKITSGSIVNDASRSSGCSWIDYDKDGWLDLFAVNGLSDNDFLYRNNGNGTFTRITSGSIVNDGSFGRGCGVGDYDNDGWPDIFVACYQGQADRLYRNNGNGTFTLTAGVIPTDIDWGSGGTFGDYDNDGWLDLFVTNNSTNNRLYHNNGNGTFSIATSSLPNNESGPQSFGAAWADYDNDGRLDLYVTNSGVNFLYKNNGSGNFTRILNETIASDPANGIASSYTDIDLDGKLELFCANNGPNGSPRSDLLYQYNCVVGNYIGIKLKGCTLNKSAIGAKVIVKAGGNTYIRELTGGQGCLSQNMHYQHFGLGSTTTIDSIIVRWTTGNIQKLSNVSANQYILIDECLVGLVTNSNEIPQEFSLLQNYPNPFNPSTKIKFTIPHNTNVNLKLFDNLGKEVYTLVNEDLKAGFYEYTFNASNLSSGIYFYQLNTEDFIETKKMVLIK